MGHDRRSCVTVDRREKGFPWWRMIFLSCMIPPAGSFPCLSSPSSPIHASCLHSLYSFCHPFHCLLGSRQWASLSSRSPLYWAAWHSHLSAVFFSSKTRSPQPVMFPEGCGGSSHSHMPECSKGQKGHRGPGQTQPEKPCFLRSTDWGPPGSEGKAGTTKPFLWKTEWDRKVIELHPTFFSWPFIRRHGQTQRVIWLLHLRTDCRRWA